MRRLSRLTSASGPGQHAQDRCATGATLDRAKGASAPAPRGVSGCVSYGAGVPAIGVAAGKTTESMVAPIRVAVTGGSMGTTWSKVMVLVASRTTTRCGLLAVN